MVGPGELGRVLEGHGADGELGHGVRVRGQRLEHRGNVGGEVRLGLELRGQRRGLGRGRNVPGQEKPQETLRAMDDGYWMMDDGYWMMDDGYWMMDDG